MVCGINALWFYDYILTLPDEASFPVFKHLSLFDIPKKIEYIWSRGSSFGMPFHKSLNFGRIMLTTT